MPHPDGPDPLHRYQRQMLLPGFGPEGQRRVLDSSVAIVGCGALGTVAADLLVRAGLGALRLIDRDTVEHTNLHRQTLYTEQDAHRGLPKAEAAAARLAAVNSTTLLVPIVADLTPRNAEFLLGLGVDDQPVPSPPNAILDCTDNFQTRYLLNDVCVKHHKPLVYGGAVGTQGMAFTIIPTLTPCLRCLFPDPPLPGSTPTCDTVGVLAPVSTIVGALQAGEALKLLLGRDDLLAGSMLDFDLWINRRRRIDLSSAINPSCPCCSRRSFDFLDDRTESASSILCGADSVQISPRQGEVDLDDLARRLSGLASATTRTSFMLRTVIDGYPITVFADGRAIIRNTSDPARARALYARYVGA